MSCWLFVFRAMGGPRKTLAGTKCNGSVKLAALRKKPASAKPTNTRTSTTWAKGSFRPKSHSGKHTHPRPKHHSGKRKPGDYAFKLKYNMIIHERNSLAAECEARLAAERQLECTKLELRSARSQHASAGEVAFLRKRVAELADVLDWKRCAERANMPLNNSAVRKFKEIWTPLCE